MSLQARPAAVVEPRRPEISAPEGSWTKDAAHSGTLPSPFMSSLPDSTSDVFRSLGERFGLMIETLHSRTIGYESYVQAVPLGGGGGSKPPPKAVMWLLVRMVPSIRRRTTAARAAFESGLIESLPRRWETEWKPEFQHRLVDARSVELAQLDDGELLAELASAGLLAVDGLRVHFDLFIPYLIGVHGLVVECERSLGWDSARVMSLLTGYSSASSEPTTALHAIAASARSNPMARALIEDRSPGLIDRLHEAAPDVADALDNWIEIWGHRCFDYDPAASTYAEQPELVAHLLRGSMHSNVLDRADSASEVEIARTHLDGDDLARFDAALAAARRVYPLREDNVHLVGTMPAAVTRRVLLEMGRRCADRGVLAARDDIFLCEMAEIEDVMGGNKVDLRSRVSTRRAEMVWVEENPGPESYGPPEGDPPDMSVLPEHARRVNAALIWAMGQEFTAPSATGANGELRGVGASPGRFTGRVRIVTNDDDFFQLEEGDVIVCRVATTSWSVLLGIAGAIVCDGGGAISHTAVIARELGIPAVLGTGNATRLLETGMTVTVDGSAGIISEMIAAGHT